MVSLAFFVPVIDNFIADAVLKFAVLSITWFRAPPEFLEFDVLVT